MKHLPVTSGGKGDYTRFSFHFYLEGNCYEVICNETSTLETMASGCPGFGMPVQGRHRALFVNKYF